MMAIPQTFTFSQSSLKDYRDCARRFQLRYLERLAWPVPQSADALESERRQRLGQDFHRLVRWHQMGLPTSALAPLAAGDARLSAWWEAYLASPYAAPEATVRRAELTLSTPLAGYRLEAQYDLVLGTPGGDWLIVDWKTGGAHVERGHLATHPQTVVYQCVLALAGAALNGGQPVAPERITMVYWFAAYPLQPAVYLYGHPQFEHDRQALAATIGEIAGRPEDVWPLTDDEKACRLCAYRSLCGRQVALPSPDELDAAGEGEAVPSLDLDLEQVEEIAF